jgi:hypothetical protein
MSEYRIADQEEKLGPPPWSPTDPRVMAWEQAHGHDVRLKCYPEFGCQVVEEQRERLIEFARWLAAMAYPEGLALRRTVTLTKVINRAREALGDVD